MRRILAAIVLVTGAIGSIGAQAASVNVTVTFDDYISSPDDALTQAGGFDFTSSVVPGGGDAIVPVNNNALVYCPDFCTMTMSRTDDSAFALHSVDIFAIVESSNTIRYAYEITGQLASGGTVTLNTTTGYELNTVSFDASWTDLSSVTFGVGPSPSFANVVDSINATVVPVPAALWLFLSAIGLLGFRRSRSWT